MNVEIRIDICRDSKYAATNPWVDKMLILAPSAIRERQVWQWGGGDTGSGVTDTVASCNFCTECAWAVDHFEDMVHHHALAEMQSPIRRKMIELLEPVSFSEWLWFGRLKFSGRHPASAASVAEIFNTNHSSTDIARATGRPKQL
jgi:hypothetical protein